jgi:hypothetical protein
MRGSYAQGLAEKVQSGKLAGIGRVPESEFLRVLIGFCAGSVSPSRTHEQVAFQLASSQMASAVCGKIAKGMLSGHLFRKSLIGTMAAAGICFSSTVTVIRDGDRIAVAADSLVNTGPGPIQACKIVQVQRCFFAASGSWNPSQGFDLLNIGRKACESGGTFAERVATFHKLVEAPMLRFVEADRNLDPEHYQHLVRDGIIDAVFFGIENGHAVVIQTGYELNAMGRAVPFTNHSSNSQGDMFQLGQTAAIQRFYRTRAGSEWFNLPIVQRVRELIELEEADQPKLVGGKISVVLSQPEADKWIDRGACQ